MADEVSPIDATQKPLKNYPFARKSANITQDKAKIYLGLLCLSVMCWLPGAQLSTAAGRSPLQ
jgi:hypothetical protein